MKYDVNKAKQKQVLGIIRGSGYAHPGGEEAIDMVLPKFPKNAKLLDVGCGLGETAHYISKKGFDKIVGIDLDS